SPETLKMSYEPSHWIHVTAPGFAPLSLGYQHVRKQLDRWLLDPYLSRGATIVGRVIDGDSRAPLPGAGVRGWSAAGFVGIGRQGRGGSINSPFSPWLIGETHCDDEGRFRLDSMPVPGFHDVSPDLFIHAWQEGYAVGQTPVLEALKDGD